MNREMKFRIRDKYKKERHTNLGYSNIQPSIKGGIGYIELLNDTDLEFMQYTGLKDKNGKEIYEGDIVCGKKTVMSDREEIMPNYINIRKDDNFKYSDGTISKRRYGQQIYIVERDESSCGFEPFADSKYNCGCCGGGINGNSIEIMGNIYENPELLSPTNPQDSQY